MYDDGSQGYGGGYGGAMDYQQDPEQDPTKRFQLQPYGSKIRAQDKFAADSSDQTNVGLVTQNLAASAAGDAAARQAEQGKKSKDLLSMFASIFGGG